MVEQIPTRRHQTIRSYAGLIAVIGLLALVGSGIVYVLNQAWVLQSQIGAGLGALLLLGAVLLRPDAIHTALTGRSVKYGSNAVIMSLAFLGILGLINILSVKNNREYDLTETGEFTLSEQTIQILDNISEPIQIIGFFQATDDRLKIAKDYLERYSRYTDQLTYEFHDPNIEPALAQSFELNNYGLVFISGNHRYETSRVDEQTITSGLIRVTSPEQKMVYFITGHGEPSIDDSAPEGYNLVKQALERENYLVQPINLSVITDTFLMDQAVLILAGPEHQLLDSEVQLISDWMSNGGKLMVLVDPLKPVPMRQLLHTYGLALGNDFVVDLTNSLVTLSPKGLTQQLTAPMINQYPFHEITRDLNGFQSLFPFARSITITSTDLISRTASAILSTSPDSWAETDLKSTQFEYTQDLDLPGPIHIGATVEDYDSDARLVLFGNAGFITNQNTSPQWANLDLFINAVNWLAEEEQLISIRPKQPANRRVFLTPFHSNLTLFTTVIFLPLAIFVVGIGIWWKRR